MAPLLHSSTKSVVEPCALSAFLFKSMRFTCHGNPETPARPGTLTPRARECALASGRNQPKKEEAEKNGLTISPARLGAAAQGRPACAAAK